ncbi:unnamed protein product [Ectocarpus sp. CCAP 1310/34]|nr:unnamed protein product [Ectocarpus sp. CCAP 1310/34]
MTRPETFTGVRREKSNGTQVEAEQSLHRQGQGGEIEHLQLLLQEPSGLLT